MSRKDKKRRDRNGGGPVVQGANARRTRALDLEKPSDARAYLKSGDLGPGTPLIDIQAAQLAILEAGEDHLRRDWRSQSAKTFRAVGVGISSLRPPFQQFTPLILGDGDPGQYVDELVEQLMAYPGIGDVIPDSQYIRAAVRRAYGLL